MLEIIAVKSSKTRNILLENSYGWAAIVFMPMFDCKNFLKNTVPSEMWRIDRRNLWMYRQVSHLWAGVSHLFRQEAKYLMIYCGQMARAEAMGSTALKNFTL